LDLTGETALTIRRLIVPLTVAFVAVHAGQGFAQGAFPAPLPGQPPVNDPAFPPVNGVSPKATIAAPAPSSFPVTGAPPVSAGFARPPTAPQQGGGPPVDCMKEFVPMREDAEKRGKLIKEASDRHASADEACKLIGNFGLAEIKMIKYVESHSAQCGIPPQVADQLKAGHKNTDAMQKKVCAVAQQQQQKGPSGPSLSEILGSSAELPDAKTAKKSGGSTFDTLSGNVLSR
jgi:hypothetical protein